MALFEEALAYLEQARLRADELLVADVDIDHSLRVEQHQIQPVCDRITLGIDVLLRRIEGIEKDLKKAILRLETKLQPQWTARDEVKDRYGEKRWKKNPNPKNDYAERRRMDEEALEKRREQLTKLNLLKERAMQIKEKSS